MSVVDFIVFYLEMILRDNMKLNTGTEVDICGSIQVENNNYLVVKLPNAVYINGLLARHVLVRQYEFEEYCDQVKKESNELTTIPHTEEVVVCEEQKESNESMD